MCVYDLFIAHVSWVGSVCAYADPLRGLSSLQIGEEELDDLDDITVRDLSDLAGMWNYLTQYRRFRLPLAPTLTENIVTV